MAMQTFQISVVLVTLLGLAWSQAQGQSSNQYIDPCTTKTRTSPHESQCDAYYSCHNGQETLEYCPNGLVYLGKRVQGLFGVCDYPTSVDCTNRPQRSFAQTQSQPDPCQNKFRVVADETHCDRYWECINGEPQLFDCPNGLVFVGRNRGIAEGCDYPWRTYGCQTKAQANPPISTEHCEWLYGIFGHETSCTRYWTCWNGTATEQFCIGGLLYSEETHACDWPQNVGGCQKHPLCKDDPNANVPLGKSCQRYWACQGGYPRLQRCPATLVFDRESRRCTSPPTLDCEVPPTTPRPAQQNRQGGGGGQQNRQGGGGGQQNRQGGGGGQQVRDQIASPQRPRVQQRRPQLPAEEPQTSPQRPTFAQSRPQRPQFSPRPQPQEQELPPREQFFDEPLIEEPIFEEAPQDQRFQEERFQDPRIEEPRFQEEAPQEVRNNRPARPQRPRPESQPSFGSGSNSGRGPRLPPIPGAIPIQFN